MTYVKKMCILRQIKQGFSGDGKALSGLIKVEQYGKNLAVEVSIINFAPLLSGEYFCLLSDGRGKTEMLSLRGKSIFNILTDLDVSGGFCGIICYVKTEVVPIAYGINGNGAYDWRAILNKAMPPVFPQKKEPAHTAYAEILEGNEPTMYETNEKSSQNYDDERIAAKNYFEEEKHERVSLTENSKNAEAQSGAEGENEEGTTAEKNDDAENVRDAFKMGGEDYYQSVKRELDELFAKYPTDDTLTGAFEKSEWVRLRGKEGAPEFLVGALFEDGRAKYICYALAAKDKNEPPQEIKGVCSFVPVSPYVGAEGFFVIFQSAATGECVKPRRI